MKKLIVCCAASALLGGAVAGWLFDSHTNLLAPAAAQEARAPVRPAIPLASASLAPNAGLTQEELTNIRVYDGANRGVGQRVYALGNPFGLEGTLTTGIISNLNRTLPSRTGRDMKSIIQTDAPMNPGNSGGPLLDTGGRMIGMNVAIATKSGQSAGLGFAIPINRIRQIVPQLIQHGKVVRADIGIVAVKEMDKGLQIVEVNKGGPAERAGLLGWETVRKRVTRGTLAYDVERHDPSGADIIMAINGQPVESAATFVDKMDDHQPGENVVLTILRQGRQMQVPVTLGSS